jgi:hypothetical protein
MHICPVTHIRTLLRNSASVSLFRKFVDAEQAAAEVKHGLAVLGLGFELFGHAVETLLALFLDFEKAGFLHDSEVF